MNRAHASIDYNTLRGFHNEYEFVKQAILADNSLTEDEKTEARGFSKIYTAYWIGGYYNEWDSKKQHANQNWFKEAESHLNISVKYPKIVKCYGLTQNPSNGNYMLVMSRMDLSLREYLQQNHNHLKWKERIKIAFLTINALYRIHEENSIHRDLNSGNILYSQFNDSWYIGDLGFFGPADKPSLNYEHDHKLATNIVNGIRPKIVPGTPLEYENLMKQCWDADPLKRPKIRKLLNEISEIDASYQNVSDELQTINNSGTSINLEINYTSKRLFVSKVHQFDNFLEPRNATEEEQEAFYSKSYDLIIFDNIDDSNNSNYVTHLKNKQEFKRIEIIQKQIKS
ncbi:kinase-like domain-containing protein [Rhizophagus clarus]|uniref:Kinase-like domain-containing protein n=1 Tax=Rhizophagus clarus TaxID=94130 RepID=A0A8H3LX30_9GLOM|nr:kinase-like domain-containing protein [Rhizophagus clarus]